MKEILRLRLLLPVLSLFVTFAASAQAPTGDISGTVYDESPAVVPAAPVLIVNKDTGLQRTFTTGPTGTFVAASIPAGIYHTKLDLTGFRTLIRPATVETA